MGCPTGTICCSIKATLLCCFSSVGQLTFLDRSQFILPTDNCLSLLLSEERENATIDSTASIL